MCGCKKNNRCIITFNCETQSHSVHWLSSSIFACLFVRPHGYIPSSSVLSLSSLDWLYVWIFFLYFFPLKCDSLILISLRCKVTEIFHHCLLDLNFSHIQNSAIYVILVECLLVLKLFTYLIVTLRIPLTHFILVECPLGGVIYCCRRGPTHKGLSNPLMQN